MATEKNAAKVVSAAILGLDFRTVIVGGKAYVIHPPTIHRIAGAAYWLCDLGRGDTLREMLSDMADYEKLSRALSWFVNDDDTLWEELSRGTLDEVRAALETAFDMIGVENFLRLSVLTRSVRRLTAQQR